MANKASKRFILNTYLYRSQNDAALLAPKIRKPEGKEAVNPEGMDANKQEQMMTKQNLTYKMHANEIHANLGHPVE